MKIIFAVLAIIFAIGTVGAYDCGNIGFGQFVIQMAIALVVEWIALKSLNKDA